MQEKKAYFIGIAGMGMSAAAILLKEQGWSDEDIQHLLEEAEIKMSELAQQFENAGINRKWKLKDMIFDINFDEKHIRSITPVDWERTIIDEQ